MKRKIKVDPETAYKISHLFSEDYPIWQIANILHVSQHTVVDVVQRDAAQRYMERSFYGKVTPVSR